MFVLYAVRADFSPGACAAKGLVFIIWAIVRSLMGGAVEVVIES